MVISRDEMYRESNKGAMDYAKNAIQFAFLLNGAAATALFAKAGKEYVFSAAVLAIGALLAVLCMGLTYGIQMLLAETWRQENSPYSFYILGKWRKITFEQIEALRGVAISVWILSIALSFIGLIMAAVV